MSRMGDTIRKNRVKSGLSEKQLAKKTGLAESFIKEVELGRRIPSDEQAERILKACGFAGELGAEIEAAAEPVTEPRPRPRAQSPAKKPAQTAEKAASAPGDAWLDALGGVIKRVPVIDSAGATVAHLPEPIIDGRIHGGAPDKVSYFKIANENLSGFGIHAGDLLLTVPERQPNDGSFMLFARAGGRREVFKVKTLEGSKLCLQTYDRELKLETVLWGEVQILGRCVKLIREI